MLHSFLSACLYLIEFKNGIIASGGIFYEKYLPDVPLSL